MSDTSNSSMFEAVRRHWQPVIRNIVAACQGDSEAVEKVAPFLRHLSDQDDWRELTAVLQRILDGEREPVALLRELDPTDRLIAGNVLDLLGVDLSPVAAELAQRDADDEELVVDELSLIDFINMIVTALRHDASAKQLEDLLGMTQAMAEAEDSPEELRQLGRWLHELLHEPERLDLAELPVAYSAYLQGALATLLGPRRLPAIV